jgi:hypothetical protein
MVKTYLQRSSRSSWGGRVELPSPPAPLPPRFTPAICTCIIWKKAKGSCRLRIFTSCLAPARTPPVVRPKTQRASFTFVFRLQNPNTLEDSASSFNPLASKILRIRLPTLKEDSANTRIHSERFCQVTLACSPRFCEYAFSLWNILRVTLVCSPRFCDYAHSLCKIPRVHSIHSPRFREYGHSLNKIPQIRFTFAIPRFCEEAHSLWNILWVIIISAFFWNFLYVA